MTTPVTPITVLLCSLIWRTCRWNLRTYSQYFTSRRDVRLRCHLRLRCFSLWRVLLIPSLALSYRGYIKFFSDFWQLYSNRTCHKIHLSQPPMFRAQRLYLPKSVTCYQKARGSSMLSVFCSFRRCKQLFSLIKNALPQVVIASYWRRERSMRIAIIDTKPNVEKQSIIKVK